MNGLILIAALWFQIAPFAKPPSQQKNAQPPRTTNWSVMTASAMITSTFRLGATETYVIGPDGMARTCPTGFHVYVLVGDLPMSPLFPLKDGATERSRPGQALTIACIKVEVK